MKSLISCSNQICEWIIIIICAIVSGYYSKKHIETPYAAHEAAEEAPHGVECRANSVSFAVLNIVGPIIWLLIFVLNTLAISLYHKSVFKQLYKVTLIKFEILLRSAGMSLMTTYVTTEVIKCYVPRKRPCYWDMIADGDEIGAMKSFPSGHTSYAFSVFYLLTLYLMNSLLNSRKIVRMTQGDGSDTNDKGRTDSAGTTKGIKMDKVIDVHNGDAYLCLWLFLKLKRCHVIGLLFVIAPTAISLGIGCSRITDFRHRYSDVIAGAFIGMVFASLSFVYYKSEFYHGFRYDEKKILTDDVDDNMC